MPDVFDRLRRLLAGGEGTSVTELEMCHAVVTERVLQQIHAGDRVGLDESSRRLRRIYEVVAADSADGYESEGLFNLGRVVALIELAGEAVEHLPPPEVVALIGQPEFRSVLDYLRKGPAPSKSIETDLHQDKGTLSRRLKRLNELGLVVTRRAGQSAVSQITPLGEQTLDDCPPPREPTPAKTPSRQFWKHLDSPVAIA